VNEGNNPVNCFRREKRSLRTYSGV